MSGPQPPGRARTPPGRGTRGAQGPADHAGDAAFDISAGERGVDYAVSEGGISAASSHISKPKWRRMLKAAAQSLGKQVRGEDQSRRPEVVDREMQAAFEHPDAVGGGSEADIQKCLRQLLEDLNLGDEDTGTILIGTYHFLQAEDIHVNSKSWRPLVVTALLAAVGMVLAHDLAQTVQERIKRAVQHWWPRHKADEAYHVFISRQVYKSAPKLTPQVLLTWYFELREKGLMMSNTADSTTEAVASDITGSEMSQASQGRQQRSPGRGGRPPLGALPSALPDQRRDRSREGSMNSQDHSLMVSEDSSWADSIAPDNSVISL